MLIAKDIDSKVVTFMIYLTVLGLRSLDMPPGVLHMPEVSIHSPRVFTHHLRSMLDATFLISIAKEMKAPGVSHEVVD